MPNDGDVLTYDGGKGRGQWAEAVGGTPNLDGAHQVTDFSLVSETNINLETFDDGIISLIADDGLTLQVVTGDLELTASTGQIALSGPGISLFGAAGLAGAARPEIDISGIGDPTLNAVLTALAALGVIIDTSP